MNEITLMNKKIVSYSIMIGAVVSIIGGIVFQSIYVFGGVIIGLVTGLLGYKMIVQLALNLEPDEKIGKRKGAVNYIIRYCIYACIFFAAAYMNFPVIALLIGFLCHKLSIFVYALLEKRKEG